MAAATNRNSHRRAGARSRVILPAAGLRSDARTRGKIRRGQSPEPRRRITWWLQSRTTLALPSTNGGQPMEDAGWACTPAKRLGLVERGRGASVEQHLTSTTGSSGRPASRYRFYIVNFGQYRLNHLNTGRRRFGVTPRHVLQQTTDATCKRRRLKDPTRCHSCSNLHN